MFEFKRNEHGSIIVSILSMTLLLTVIIYALLVLANVNLTRARGRIMLLQAQYSAESGADFAIAQLNSGLSSYSGTGSDVEIFDNGRYKTTYSVSVANGADSKERIITAVGKVYAPVSESSPSYVRTIEVIARQTSTSGSSSMLSRNIIDIASGVKDIYGVDVYLNGYINMAKNTNTLIAENITVAGRNTGSDDCSIGGNGDLEKPTTFVNPGQTKTKLLLAYNNCIDPPGNVTDSDFDVYSNDGSVSKIQSTYIPWGTYMDAGYQDSAANDCSDWTSGAFPRDIPRTGNDKKTHYPDKGSGVSADCGTSGDLYLQSGQYNLRNHAHIRADLCANTACKPIFNNPDPGILKFVFVEGSINFDSLETSAGSGPIVFVSYGTDPASKAGACPTGGSIFLGNGGNTVAPAIYLLANNGLCLYQTKFGTNPTDPQAPALGGISGKNLYIATNSGSPWDLQLDPNFPVDSIPVDLSWRAAQYRRL